MNIGTLTGQIELDDLLSGVLMKVDARLKAVEEAANSSMSMTAGKMTLAVAAGTALANVLTTITTRAVSFGTDIIKNSIMAGAELARLANVSEFLGQKLGYSKKYVDDLSASIEKSGITGQEARNAIIQLENAHVDLSKAAQLSGAAQNMAVISGRGSSETYGMIIHAITTLNPLMIRNAGFTFTMEKVLSDYERTTGRTTSTMGQYEKQGLLVNAMLEEAKGKQGLYNMSLETSAKQLTSAERAWTQVSEQIGTAVLPITDALTNAWYKLATATRDSAVDGKGAVKELMTAIGSGVADVIKKLTEFAETSVKTGKAVYNAYSELPDVYKDIAKVAGTAALGVWALEAALSALMKSSLVAGIVASGKALSSYASGLKLVYELGGSGAVLQSLGTGLATLAATPVGVTALLTGLALALYEVAKAVSSAYTWWKEGKPMWDFFTQRDDSNFVRRLFNMDTGPIKTTTAAIDDQRAAMEKLMKAGGHGADEAAMAAARAQAAEEAAAEERKKQLEGEYTAAVTSTVDAVRKANYEQSANAEALERTDAAVRSTKESLDIFLPQIEKQITLGRILTATQREMYVAAKAADNADLSWGMTKLKNLGVSLQEIDALKAMNVSEAEMALKYGVSTAALNARIAAMQINKGLLDELTQLESKLNDSLATQAQKQRDLTYEQGVSKLDPKSSDYTAQKQALDDIRKGSFELEMTNLDTLKNTQLSNLQTIATKETETYENMVRNQYSRITGEEEYSSTAIEAQRAVAEAAQQAAVEVYGYWKNSLEGMGSLTHEIVGQMRSELAGLGDGTFGAMDTLGNRAGLPMGTFDANGGWVSADQPYGPTAPASSGVPTGNPSGFQSVMNPAVSHISSTQQPAVVVNAQGSFFGANERQVTRTLEDMLAKSGLQKR
jgi:hypothetical protein